MIGIGREPANTIAIVDDTYLSGHHAKVSVADGRVIVDDLASRNGTYLNGARITDTRTVKIGENQRITATVNPDPRVDVTVKDVPISSTPAAGTPVGDTSTANVNANVTPGDGQTAPLAATNVSALDNTSAAPDRPATPGTARGDGLCRSGRPSLGR